MNKTNNTVLLEKQGAIATVTLNRPDKHNGLNEAMFYGLLDVAKAKRPQYSLCDFKRGWRVILRRAGLCFRGEKALYGGEVLS